MTMKYTDPSKWKSQNQDIAMGVLGLGVPEVAVMAHVADDIGM